MEIRIDKDKRECGIAAADKAEEVLKKTLAQKGRACFVVATGASQFDFLDSLTSCRGIDWSRTTMFHLDEYLGMAPDHPASFQRYLRERLVQKVHPGTVHFVDGLADDPRAECDRLKGLISREDVDAAFIGIGENGHLAFNDPPADFETEEPFIVVELDEACRRQQHGEGWFATFEEVPTRAISMSMRQIMKAGTIICTVPDQRKAQAVRDCFEGEVSPLRPASLLLEHDRAFLFLDEDSASLLKREA